ncbi:hypothetical protein REPUB_Repub18cG0114300 [Reevesia pubescens]
MEMTGDPPPLWPQLTNSRPGHRRRSPSPLLTPPVLIILLPIIALLFLFFAVPPFLSITTQIFRPNGVRKSWDSLNIFIVLFAVLCGVFARRNDDDDNINNNNIRNDSNNIKSSHPVSQQWFDQYPERKIYDDPSISSTTSLSATNVRRLKRSSSSYPDLRQESLWENTEDDRFRFFDDFEINKYRSSTSYDDQVHELRRSWRSGFDQESESKVIPVDTFVLRSSPLSPPSSSPAPSTTTPPPPPPPPSAARHKPRRTYQAVGQKEKVMTQNDHVEFNKIMSPQPVTPPAPPPPPPRRPPSPLVQMGNRSEQRYAKLERRKSNAAKEIKMVFASLRKRKKKQKAKDQYHDHQQDCPLHSPRESPVPYYSTTIPPPPPPPLPPPPSSVFQKYNLFRKSKKIHSVPAPPPPPPPPAAFSVSKRSSKQNNQIPQTPPPAPPPATKRLSKEKSQIPPPSKPPPPPPPATPPQPEPSRRRTTADSRRPPLPTKANTSYYDENVNSGGQSPLIPIPPPPPPFKMPEFKFVVRGDFVKIRSSPSSRCGSPDLDEVDVSSFKDDVEKVSMMDGDDGVGVEIARVPVFCPSPDVNAKAETFIARHRDGWRLEKINSMKEKQMI